MRQREVRVVLIQQERINLKEWTTQELKTWVEASCLCSYINENEEICICITEELNLRERIYEDIKPCTNKRIEELLSYDY